jgi:hypothetical protein
VLTIKRNEHSPSREIAVHNQRKCQMVLIASRSVQTWCGVRGFWPDALIAVSRRDIASAFEICPVDWDAAFSLTRWAIRNTNGSL